MLSGILAFSALLGVALGCGVPPRHWCDTVVTAQQCQVLDSCVKYAWSNQQDAPRVKLSLYYETLCPGCQMFIGQQVGPAYKQIGNIMDIEFVPYGNAHETHDGTKWVFQCQHGEQECVGNVITTCSMDILKNFTTYFPFILCMETAPGMDYAKVGPECAQKLSIDFAPIDACYKGTQGNQLEHQMALKTEALNPPHKYTPWIVINGKHTETLQQRAQRNLVEVICETYTGTKPDACSQYTEIQPPRCYN